MKALRLALLIVGIACTVVFLSVNYTRTATTAGDVSELRIGLEASPWLKREMRDGAGSSEVNLVSWSSVFALVAVAAFLAYARSGTTGQANAASRAEPSAAAVRPRD
jgi:hypothetical protein